MKSAAVVLPIVLVLFTSGCLRTRPTPPIPNGDYTKQMLADVSDKDLLKNYNAMAEPMTTTKPRKLPGETRS